MNPRDSGGIDLDGVIMVSELNQFQLFCNFFIDVELYWFGFEMIVL